MDLLHPLSTERFLSTHWGLSPAHVSRDDPGFFESWVTVAELDRLVTSIRMPATNVNLARGNEPLPLSAYADGDFIDKKRMLDLHLDGATIILRAAEQWSPEMNRLRIGLEQFFDVPAQINVYFTPSGEKSTPPHWDTHDLIVLQVKGSKRWRLFDADRTDPLPNERFRAGEDGAAFNGREYLLRAGDTFYLPCGTIHEPIADSYSIHLSVGLHRPRLADVAAEVLRLAAAKEGSLLRRAARPQDLIAPDGVAFEDLFTSTALISAAALVSSGQRSGQAVDLQGRLLELSSTNPGDPMGRYELRAGVRLTWGVRDGLLTIDANGTILSAPQSLEPAVVQIANKKAFEATCLSGSASIEQKQALCAALWQVSATSTAKEARRSGGAGREPSILASSCHDPQSAA